MSKKIKCSKLELLQFIQEHGIVETYEVEQKWNYRDVHACEKLSRLKKQGLIIDLQRGHWELTVEGHRRLKFYGNQKKD